MLVQILHYQKCSFISIKSWPIFIQKSLLCLSASEDWHCQQDAAVPVPAPRGVVEAFLRGWGCSAPWGRGSHVSRAPLPTAIPAGHFPGATQEVSGEAATGTPRMNEALQLTLAQAGSLYWTHCGTTKRDLSCTERDKEEGQVSNFSRLIFSKKKDRTMLWISSCEINNK